MFITRVVWRIAEPVTGPVLWSIVLGRGDYRGHAGSLLMIVWGVVKRLSIDFPLVAVRLSGVCRALFARAPVRVRQRRCSRFLHAGLAPAIGR